MHRMNTRTMLGILLGCLAAPAAAQSQPSVTFGIEVPDAAQSFRAGQDIEWLISIETSGPGLGLALGIVDLVAPALNPGPVNLAPGAAPIEMVQFDVPLGFANVTPSGSAYGGTPHADSSGTSLREIGGAQNTIGPVSSPGFGQAAQPILGVPLNRGHEGIRQHLRDLIARM